MMTGTNLIRSNYVQTKCVDLLCADSPALLLELFVNIRTPNCPVFCESVLRLKFTERHHVKGLLFVTRFSVNVQVSE